MPMPFRTSAAGIFRRENGKSWERRGRMDMTPFSGWPGYPGRTARWGRTVVGERHVGDARFDTDGLIYDWFDYWLEGKENDVLKKTPKVQYYTMGLNKWQSSDTC